MTRRRVCFLWTRRSGYFDACVEALADLGVDVLVHHTPTSTEAPFERRTSDTVEFVPRSPTVSGIQSWAPDATVVSGWHGRASRAVARALRGSAVRVVTIDHQWEATARQRLGVVSSPVYLRSLFDVALVAGDRQREFARRLGFATDEVWEPLYSADVEQFSKAPPGPRRGFAFVGRAVPEKGFDVLLEAYLRYRTATSDPWQLTVFGTGPMLDRADGLPIEVAGFVQPDELPTRLANHAALVLPSRYEPWGVVVHEAAAGGLGLLLSERVGAAQRFLVDGVNGFVVSPTPDGLVPGLHAYAAQSRDALERAAETSRKLASTITPAIWARALLANIERRRKGAT